jgi:hypothetical protein
VVLLSLLLLSLLLSFLFLFLSSSEKQVTMMTNKAEEKLYLGCKGNNFDGEVVKRETYTNVYFRIFYL